jgi:phospholipid/cholesterol/gamma-HCH transport system substrate-binding protein
MRKSRGQLTASPVLIGAATVLVAIVAVFISYNANQGLPFVPTYKLDVEVPNASKLVKGNEVRAGGFRVGVVDGIRVVRRQVDGKQQSVALLELKLDKKIEPLSTDSRFTIRPRSALGLKYVEVTPGRSQNTFQTGDTVPLGNADPAAPELEDVLSMFGPRTRVDAQRNLLGFGDAFAGRGQDINDTIASLRPFLARLEPVMRNLSSPRSELARLVPALGAAAAEVAPVADVQAKLFGDLADTFAAIDRDPAALQDTITETPPTLTAATESFAVQTPFLAHFTDLSRRLQPAAAALREELPAINRALAAGPPAFRETPQLANDLQDLLQALQNLSENPNTLLALRDLRRAVQVSAPAIKNVAPYQTVCNYLVYFFNPLGTHQSEIVPGGTDQRILPKLSDLTQLNTMGLTESIRPVDVPSNQSSQPPDDPQLQALHSQFPQPAVDSKGNADCQSGQTGYMSRLITNGRWPPDNSSGGFIGGGSHVVVDGNTPGLLGGTYKARQLGIDNLKDVP